MISIRRGGVHELKAPGYVIRANSRAACFDTYFLCLINNVPSDTFSPTEVTVDETGHCEFRSMSAEQAIRDDLAQFDELLSKARELSQAARNGFANAGRCAQVGDQNAE